MGDGKPAVEPDPADVAAIGRDRAALEVFYRRHVADVTRFVARRISDPHTVDDLTTEVFLAAIDSAERYQAGRGSPRAWLLGIAQNVVAAEWRRHAGELDKARRVGVTAIWTTMTSSGWKSRSTPSEPRVACTRGSPCCPNGSAASSS